MDTGAGNDAGRGFRESADPTRRDFLRAAGGLLVAGSGLLGVGCNRVLDWSAGLEGGTERTMTRRDGSPTPTSASPTGTTPGTGAGTTGPSTDPVSTTTTSPVFPDLAVIRGPDPGRNLGVALAALGGMSRFVARGDRVILKPNVVTGRAPEYAVNTNPALIGALARACYEVGAGSVVVLDRPTTSPRTAFEVSGIAQAAAAADASVKYLSDRNFENIAIPEGRLLTSWPLVTDIFEADVVINVPIAKDHGMAGLTMAVKNLMGIMGGSRGLIHVDFTQKIVDLHTLVRPHLAVLDAHRILLRNGPTGGRLDDVRLAETLVVGTDQVAVDTYGATLFGMRGRDLGYLAAAEDRGLGTTDLASLRVFEGTAA